MNPKFEKEALRVYRGGSWFRSAGYARAAYRLGGSPGNRYGGIGFRLCRDVPFTADNSTPTRRSEDVQED
jgi:formylglycine-generating enzyme required for sulfatase activity